MPRKGKRGLNGSDNSNDEGTIKDSTVNKPSKKKNKNKSINNPSDVNTGVHTGDNSNVNNSSTLEGTSFMNSTNQPRYNLDTNCTMYSPSPNPIFQQQYCSTRNPGMLYPIQAKHTPPPAHQMIDQRPSWVD